MNKKIGLVGAALLTTAMIVACGNDSGSSNNDPVGPGPIAEESSSSSEVLIPNSSADEPIPGSSATVPTSSETVPASSAAIPASSATIPASSATIPASSATVPASSATVPAVSSSSVASSSSVELGPTEKTYAFGYAIGNAPRASKGCGKASSLQKIGTVENGDKFQINVNGTNRTFFVTLPKNYDNTKPYKLLIANHCMGSKAEDFVHHSPDYDHPTPYYGQQKLDTDGNYIFAAPQGDDSGMWTKGEADHKFFDQFLTTLEDNYCVDTSRVFVTGFSFGAMFTNSLAQSFQHRFRAVAVYAVAAYNIYLPTNAGKPLAWMAVHGKNDAMCSYDRAKNEALPLILKNNGKASDGDSKFTDASSEKPQEFNGTAGHLCYDFKNVDERFPVKFCSWNGGHQWTAHDGANTQVGVGWENTWVPDEVHKFFEQF